MFDKETTDKLEMFSIVATVLIVFPWNKSSIVSCDSFAILKKNPKDKFIDIVICVVFL